MSEEIKNETENKDRKKTKKGLKILLVVLIVLAALVGAVYGMFKHYYGKANYVKDEDVSVIASLPEEAEEEEGDDSITESEQEAIKEELAGIEFPNGGNVYNILLIGSDRRDDSWYGNSDAMILLSVNKDTSTMQLTSFMRDSYADIPNVGGKKLNAAHAYGGGPLLVKTLEENYKIDIDNYAEVDFDGLMDVVDAVGGVEIEVRDAELKELNSFAAYHAEKSGRTVEPIEKGGTYNLNGAQAVAYARIRHIGNADYERTERQRKVITKIIEKARTLSVGELNSLANTILPLLVHNMTETDVIKLMTDLPSIMTYEVKQQRIPYDNMYHSSGEILVPDFGPTIEQLHASIYGTDASGAES